MTNPEQNGAASAPPARRRRPWWHGRTAIMLFLLWFLAAAYWGVIASDRYVSEAVIVVQRADLPVGTEDGLGGVLASLGGGSRDEDMLRAYLLSVDMLRLLDRKLGLRDHYADRRWDPLSRMWFQDAPLEWFHRYYLARTHVVRDPDAGVLVIRAEAFEPRMAQRVAAELVSEGERYLNELVHRLAREQVAFLEGEVQRLRDQLNRRQADLLAFQNEVGLLSPEKAAESRFAIVGQLQSQIAELKAQRSLMRGYLSPDAPALAQIDLKIHALEQQLAEQERFLVSGSGDDALNAKLAKHQRLKFAAAFAEEMYRGALTALERGRMEAARSIKKVAVLQAPTLPEYPVLPRRIYNITVVVLVSLLLAGIAHLIIAIVRDHRD